MIRLGITAIVNFNGWDAPDYNETGGINSVVKNLLPYLQADKIVLYGITYDRRDLLKEKRISDRLSVFPVVYASATSRIPKRVWALLYGWRLRKYLRQHAITVVYSHAEELAYGIPGAIPYIHHLHTYVNVLDVSGKKLARLQFLKNVWETLRTRTIRNAAKIIAVNQDVVVMGERIIGSDRVIAFPNYVDMRVFTYRDATLLREKLGLQQKRIALFIGRISYVKGLELFADTIQALNRRDGTSWVGVIVGNGDYQPTLEAYLSDHGIRQQFIFTGPVNAQEALREYYSLADVFLITSLSESVPLTLLESLACGTPVVSTDVGIASVVLRGDNGFVVASRDANEFSEKVLTSVSLKTTANLVPTPYDYSVERASALLNREFEHYSHTQKSSLT